MTRLGIDIGGTTVKFGIVDDTFRILEEAAIPTGAERPTEAVVEDIIEAARPLIEKYSPVTVGIGSPGSIDSAAGVVLRAGNLPFRNVPLASSLEEALGLPTYLENDANCALIAEVAAGVCRGCRDALILTIGTGIGGAILIDGRIYHGHNNLAGELGHFVIQHGGRQCACGMKGCFEQYASATALVRQTEEAIAENPGSILARLGAVGVDGRTVFAAVAQNCPVAEKVLPAPDDRPCRRRRQGRGCTDAAAEAPADSRSECSHLHPERHQRHHRRCHAAGVCEITNEAVKAKSSIINCRDTAGAVSLRILFEATHCFLPDQAVCRVRYPASAR